MPSPRLDFSRDIVVVRFGLTTPFYPFSTSYGMLWDGTLGSLGDDGRPVGVWFVSMEHYLGYHMLSRDDHRAEVVNSPNGWIANQNLQRILRGYEGMTDHVIRPDWEERRRDHVLRGTRLRFSQSIPLRQMLLSTGKRTILDDSRVEDVFMCHARGRGANTHGQILEQVRDECRRHDPVLEQCSLRESTQ